MAIGGAALMLGALATIGVLILRSPSTGSFEGRLTKARNAPLPHTKVALRPVDADGSASETASDAGGRFSFAEVEQGRYTVSITYDVAGVFACDLRYPVEIRAEETVRRRFRIPLVDVAPDGTGKVRKGQKTRCRTLRDPVAALLCEGSQMPIQVFTLPPRRETTVKGYKRLGAISERACGRVSVLGHLPGASPLTYRPLGWLLVAVPGAPRLRGWIFPAVRELGAEHRAWWDVAQARTTKLATPKPTLRGRLPDLEFTTPRHAQQVGDPCFMPGLIAAEWAVNVRNAGKGLAPKRFEVFIDNGSQTELRLLGDAAWVRGLAPGEIMAVDDYNFEQQPGDTHTFLGLNAFTRLRLDPNDRIKESDETNNELSLGYLPQLRCVEG